MSEATVPARDCTGAIPVRVLLVDNNSTTRASFRAALKPYDDIDIVGDADDGATAAELTKSLRPDVALVDVELSGLDGFEVAGSLRGVSPVTRVAMISDGFGNEAVYKGLSVGVYGFILKSESHDLLAAFVRAISRGAFCSSGIIRETFTLRSDSVDDLRLHQLTVGERAMIVELAKGRSLKEVAGALGIRYKAADHLKQSLMKKLDIHDRVEIARFAIRVGLIT